MDCLRPDRGRQARNDRHYANQGRELASLIARREVANISGLGPALLPGSVGFHLPHAWMLNPSYTTRFPAQPHASVDPSGPWGDIAAQVPTLLARSAKGGFAMDWVCYAPGEGFTPCLANGKKGPTALGSYDAIRVYLWAGMLSDANPAKRRILTALPSMNYYMQHYNAPPEKISDQGVALHGDGRWDFQRRCCPIYAATVTNRQLPNRWGV